MDNVLSPKKLIKMSKKLQKMPIIKRKRVSYPIVVQCISDKGTFVTYTLDQRRFMLPLSYLANNIIQELFKMSEEEFGISSCDPILFPCDSRLMNYIVSLVKLGMSVDLEKALLESIRRHSCLTSDLDRSGETRKHLLLHGH